MSGESLPRTRSGVDTTSPKKSTQPKKKLSVIASI